MEELKPWPIGPQKDINIEGAIKYMKEMRSICDTDDGFVPQVYDMAIAALRRAAPENKPLTLEELRNMDGEPVWIPMPDGSGYGDWAIVDIGAQTELLKAVGVESAHDESEYGKTWIAYAHKPEGSENDG